MKGFKNSSLGEAEDTGSNRLQEADIRACLGVRSVPAVDKSAPTWIGIDMGHTCHVLVGQGSSLRNMHVVRAFRVPIGRLSESVDEIMQTYNVVGGACDRHPESLAAENLRVQTNGILIPCEYRGQKELNPVKSPETQEIIYTQVNRTQILDLAARQIRKKEIQFNGFEGLDSEIVTQYRNMIRDENPEKEAVWKKLDNNDHFFHAAAFLCAAFRIKEYVETVEGSHGVCAVVVGADMAGYTSGLIGQSTGNKSSWLRQTSSLR